MREKKINGKLEKKELRKSLEKVYQKLQRVWGRNIR